jgi:hypothetical protein
LIKEKELLTDSTSGSGEKEDDDHGNALLIGIGSEISKVGNICSLYNSVK